MMFGVPPLHLFVQELATKTFVRLNQTFHMAEDTDHDGHWSYAKRFHDDIGISHGFREKKDEFLTL